MASVQQLCDIGSHIGFREHKKIFKICQPLFNRSPVRYFYFQRFYKNGAYTFLPSAPDLAAYYFIDGKYIDSWLFTQGYEDLKTGYFFWDLCRQFNRTKKEKEFHSVIVTETGLAHGMDFIEKYETYCDCYSFASDSLALYRYPIGLLQQFITYFKQAAYQEILQAGRESLFLERSVDKKIQIPIIELLGVSDSSKENMFNIKRYYLGGELSHIYLTDKEISCLSCLSDGLTAKQAARKLNRSYRTVEWHIKNLRIKLNTNNLLEILKIVRQYKILP